MLPDSETHRSQRQSCEAATSEGTGLQFGEVEIFVAFATRSTEHHSEIMAALGELGVVEGRQ